MSLISKINQINARLNRYFKGIMTDQVKVNDQRIAAYNKTRTSSTPHVFCHAPFVSMNFDQYGNFTACCYNRTYKIGKYPKDSLQEAWFGENAASLRNSMLNYDFDEGCQVCIHQIESKNFYGTRARHFDSFDLKTNSQKGINVEFPKLLEFELSNTCNLECIMCTGEFSSSIRKNREGMSPIINPYDDDFVDQLTPFIPYLTDAKFLGGEPFLIDTYYKIWEKIREIKPDIMVHITTNATVLNNRAKNLMEAMRCGIILSLDSIEKDTYEAIRVNASYDRVMENVQYFDSYFRRKNTWMSLAVCPMTKNWKEIPQLVDYCNERKYSIFFNTVFRPEEYSIRYLPSRLIRHIAEYLENNLPESNSIKELPQQNILNYKDLISQLNAWEKDREYQEKVERDLVDMEGHQSLQLENEVSKEFLAYLSDYIGLYRKLNQAETVDDELVFQLSNGKENLIIRLKQLLRKYGENAFLDGFYELVAAYAYQSFSNKNAEKNIEKYKSVKEEILSHPKKNIIITELITSDLLFTITYIIREELSTIQYYLREYY
ncbi:MAG: twitch domain-containing radical SAM protein [Bacteroidetes bacterium]|nr:twitch domain-containing radical SAM protein [Bacteroidota bacterium]